MLRDGPAGMERGLAILMSLTTLEERPHSKPPPHVCPYGDFPPTLLLREKGYFLSFFPSFFNPFFLSFPIPHTLSFFSWPLLQGPHKSCLSRHAQRPTCPQTHDMSTDENAPPGARGVPQFRFLFALVFDSWDRPTVRSCISAGSLQWLQG